MSEIEDRYAAMWARAHAAFDSDRFEIDPLIDASADARRGLTLRVPLVGAVLDQTLAFQNRLQSIEPELYLALAGEAHFTVLSIVSCREGFSPSAGELEEYRRIVADACSELESFAVDFRGLTASPECVMLRGYPVGGQLAALRDRLRAAFTSAGCFSTIDGRYRAITAHSTLARFRAHVGQPAALIQCLDEFRDHDFGTLAVDRLELVHNDWWHRRANTRVMQTVPLG